ncbi:hypothetical protein C1I59_06100 [Paenibacillus polymyxa]|uniref:Uncharacterized protein n=1 Tax=Paenibacillus polymyxa (strain SC2) TaxID=886882 RepID=A0A0D5ZC32_PAEPS|nr:hypothetical protein PPSC2_06430 [Paenibacillus polymyxa SC2]TKH38831.1 hypothetical protein C1I59_06100 [Paenibacillus polymyxa]
MYRFTLEGSRKYTKETIDLMLEKYPHLQREGELFHLHVGEKIQRYDAYLDNLVNSGISECGSIRQLGSILFVMGTGIMMKKRYSNGYFASWNTSFFTGYIQTVYQPVIV